MNIKKHIPNLFTLGNLLCGSIAVVYALGNQKEMTAIFVVLGIVLDFFDGFVARMLNVAGELGKQLDSLADMVTSGVVPGLVMYNLLRLSQTVHLGKLEITTNFGRADIDSGFLPYVAFLLTLGAGYRLAKFNIDTRQSDSFIGLPTPAMSLFIIALPLIIDTTQSDFIKEFLSNQYVLLGITIVVTYLMNANLPLIALKFKTFGLKENLLKYILILSSVVLIVTLKYAAVPLIIVIYILLSIIENSSKKVA